jgi:hypothetical protein
MPIRRDEEDDAIHAVRTYIERRCGDERAAPEDFFGLLARQALDEVIDGPRTGRWDIEQLSKTEKTYIGTKIEIVVRSALEVPCGARTDCTIDGVETDVKWSKSYGGWMIGPENVGEVCLGICTNGAQTELSVGLVIPYFERLTGSSNRDDKRSLTRESITRHVNWIVHEAEFPQNFVAQLSDDTRRHIFEGETAQERVRRLALALSGKFIPRQAFETVAMKPDGDPIRRLRRDRYNDNGLEGVQLLGTKYKGDEIRRILDWPSDRELPKNHWFAIADDEYRRSIRR